MINQKVLFSHELAEKKAKILNDTDDWTYIVKSIPENPGYSIIEVYDEENEFVAYWNL